MSPLLEIRDLRVVFPTETGPVTALDGFSLDVAEGASIGIVGESGSGKSTAFLATLSLLPAGARVSAARLRFRGEELLGLPEPRARAIRGRHISMVFQDATAALNPTMTIGRQVAEVVETHFGAGRREAAARAAEALAAVALPDPKNTMAKYPHELSGGQRQRAAIAMAIVGNPALVVADEPTTALDPPVQAQVTALLARLRRERGLSLGFVSHDLALVAGVAERVAVVYAGRVVEEAPTAALFASPRHPYTRGLLASSLTLAGPRPRRLAAIPGAPPHAGAPPRGCAFAPRCPHANDRCRAERPGETVETQLSGERRFVCFEPLGVGR
jgi:oligopeptide/dipeptide ABC transporter ATP-binding protein